MFLSRNNKNHPYLSPNTPSYLELYNVKHVVVHTTFVTSINMVHISLVYLKSLYFLSILDT